MWGRRARAFPRPAWVGDGGEERAHGDGENGGKGQESAEMRRRGLVKIPAVLLVVEN